MQSTEQSEPRKGPTPHGGALIFIRLCQSLGKVWIKFQPIGVLFSPESIPFCNFAPMGRIKLEMPGQFPFETVLTLRVSDMNYANHLGNDRVLTLMHEARVRFLTHLGVPELGTDGQGFIQSDCAIVYKSEGFWGDAVRIWVAAGDYTRVGLDFYFRLENAADNRVVAEGKTGMVYFNFTTRKVTSIPQSLRETLGDAMISLARTENGK